MTAHQPSRALPEHRKRPLIFYQEHLAVATAMLREMDMRFWLDKALAETKLPSAPHDA